MVGRSARDSAATNIIEGCEDSLRRLGVEMIDLYWLHRDDDQTPPAEFLGALDKLVRAGKVRAVGASNFGVARFKASLGEARGRASCLSSRSSPSTA
jgi:aryl-alcohol dehydrogenase (NADP+)